MSDSVDRVFSHALNTVNKIRTGSEKPPPNVRLKLYGLYKQSMEGDVEGIMDRPTGNSEEAHRAREKWDAWKQQSGLSRTEAKRRYITALIDAMRKYASPSADARELVAELEFVWDQVKSNVPSSPSSSSYPSPPSGRDNQGASRYASVKRSGEAGAGNPRSDVAAMRVMRPVSEGGNEDGNEDVREDDYAEGEAEEEFVDAQDSQYELEPQDRSGQNVTDVVEAERASGAGLTTGSRDRQLAPNGRSPTSRPVADQKWQSQVEQALVRMTTEVAALREQLEIRRLFHHGRRRRIVSWILSFFGAAVRHVLIDLALFALVLLWLRRKKDRRLEGAVRVLLGDAVAQMQKVGETQMANIGKIDLPRLPAPPLKKSS